MTTTKQLIHSLSILQDIKVVQSVIFFLFLRNTPSSDEQLESTPGFQIQAR